MLTLNATLTSFYVLLAAPILVFFFCFFFNYKVVGNKSVLDKTNLSARAKSVQYNYVDTFATLPFLSCSFYAFCLHSELAGRLSSVAAELTTAYFFFFFNVIVIFFLFAIYRQKFLAARTYGFNYAQCVCVPLCVFTFYIFFVKNFVVFFIILELMSYMFYFQFLTLTANSISPEANQAKADSVFLYFFNNFFGSFLLFFSIATMLYSFGSVGFDDINLFVFQSPYSVIPMFLVVLGFSVKLAAAGFHFLKVKAYKSLFMDAVIVFSFMALLAYLCVLFYLFLVVPALWYVFIYFFLIINAALYGALLVFDAFRADNVLTFFGISTAITAAFLGGFCV